LLAVLGSFLRRFGAGTGFGAAGWLGALFHGGGGAEFDVIILAVPRLGLAAVGRTIWRLV
jgi:hypothetical protein